MLSVVGKLRGEGVKLELEGENLVVDAATEAQIETIRAHKNLIVSILKAEAFGGEQIDDSALLAGIQKTYRQAVELIDHGIGEQDGKKLVDRLDALLLYVTLPEMFRAYMAGLPEMQSLIASMNRIRDLVKEPYLEGRSLSDAAMHAFKKEGFSAAGI